MSALASIDIKFAESFDLNKLIDSFLSNGWQFDYEENIMILPVGDIDYDWQFIKLSDIEVVKSVIKTKDKLDEVVGVTLFNQKLNAGGTFHFDKSNQSIMVLVDINRIVIEGTLFTDYSIYVLELLRGLPDNIESITCTDSY